MQQVTLEQLGNVLEMITVVQSIDSGFAITHIGHIEGIPTIAISTSRGTGDCYIMQ